MTEGQIRQLNDVIYVGLFLETAVMLRRRLNLPVREDSLDDDILRDHLGIEALEAIAVVEGAIAEWMRNAGEFSHLELTNQLDTLANNVGKAGREAAALKGVDFITGKRVEQLGKP